MFRRHFCLSIGKCLKFIGHWEVTLSLKKTKNREKIVECYFSIGNALDGYYPMRDDWDKQSKKICSTFFYLSY